jgi:hypothetical protein
LRKIGTLTLMKMMVVSAATADTAYKVAGQGYAPEGGALRDGTPISDKQVLSLMTAVHQHPVSVSEAMGSTAMIIKEETPADRGGVCSNAGSPRTRYDRLRCGMRDGDIAAMTGGETFGSVLAPTCSVQRVWF